MNAEQFAHVAELHCGDKGTKYQSKYGLGKNDAWSVAFVNSCAQECKVLGQVIPETKSCNDYVSQFNEKQGTWIPGPSYGKEPVPRTGDVIVFVGSSNCKDRADSVGIVTSYNSKNFTVTAAIGDFGTKGSSNSTVRLMTYQTSISTIKGYYRPNWNKVV